MYITPVMYCILYLYIALVCVLIDGNTNNVFPVINCIHNRHNRSPTVTISTNSTVINIVCVPTYYWVNIHTHSGRWTCGDTLRDLREPHGARCQLGVVPPDLHNYGTQLCWSGGYVFVLSWHGMAWNSMGASNNDPINYLANSFMLFLNCNF